MKHCALLGAGVGFALMLVFATPASAQDKGGDSQDLFDALGGLDDTSGLGDLKQATEGVGPTKQKKGEGLQIKQRAETGDGKVKVLRIFAAPRIAMEKKKCVAKPKRVEFYMAPDLPLKIDRFSVCAKMAGGAARAMRMSVLVTTGRGKMIGSAESVVDFTGKKSIDHAIDFPPLELPEVGVYRYVIDIEGARVANLPLFEVRPVDEDELPE